MSGVQSKIVSTFAYQAKYSTPASSRQYGATFMTPQGIANQIVPPSNGPKRLTRAESALTGLVLPKKKQKISSRPAHTTAMRAPAFTDEIMQLYFKDDKGNYKELDSKEREILRVASGWSKSAIDRLKTKLAGGNFKHNSKGGKPPAFDQKHLDKFVELAQDPTNHISRTQQFNELRQLHRNVHDNEHGTSKPYKPVSMSILYKAQKLMGLVERAGAKCHTAARELAKMCPYTFIDTLIAFYALTQLYGILVRVHQAQASRATVGQDGGLDYTAVPESKDAQVETRRECNPRHTWYTDESMGKCCKVEEKVMVKKGTKFVGAAPKCHPTTIMNQGYNLVFGVNAAGAKLPPLVGFRCDDKSCPAGTLHVYKYNKFSNLFAGSQPAVIVIYNKKDAAMLPRIFREIILEPTVAEFTGELEEHEYHLIFQDGGCKEHINGVLSNSYVEACKEKRSVHIKTHVNATGRTSLADLITLFKMIKQPKAEIAKCSMAQYERFVREMTAEWDALFTPFFKPDKRGMYIEALAVLFNITLPSMHVFNVQSELSKLGQYPLDPRATLSRCGTKLDDATVDRIISCIPELGAQMIKDGFSSDALKDRLLRDSEGKLLRLSKNLDDAPLRSMRVVFTSDPALVEMVVARINAPLLEKQKKEQDAEKARLAEQKRQQEDYKRILNKNKKITVPELLTVCTVESLLQTVPDADVEGDVKCSFCPLWWCVVERWTEDRPEKFVSWMMCGTTQACFHCCPKLKTAKHKNTCLECSPPHLALP